MNHPIHFVSLGPGDPELITLKGLNTLQKADIIYCPATQGKHGIISRATDILKAIEVDESLIHPFILPMSKERTDALNAYNELFLDAQAEYLKGKQIVIVAEGDAERQGTCPHPHGEKPVGRELDEQKTIVTIAHRISSVKDSDLAALFAAAHERGMHVILDLVPGHTSEEHEWFRHIML